MEELGDLAVKRGGPNHVQGGKLEVVCWVALDGLDEGSLQGSVDVVPDGNLRGGKG